MSEGDDDQYLDWFDKEYPTGQTEDQLEDQFQLDLIKAKIYQNPMIQMKKNMIH